MVILHTFVTHLRYVTVPMCGGATVHTRDVCPPFSELLYYVAESRTSRPVLLIHNCATPACDPARPCRCSLKALCWRLTRSLLSFSSFPSCCLLTSSLLCLLWRVAVQPTLVDQWLVRESKSSVLHVFQMTSIPRSNVGNRHECAPRDPSSKTRCHSAKASPPGELDAPPPPLRWPTVA